MRLFVRALAKSLTATLVLVLVAEALLRVTYLVRNSMVLYVPLPYSLGDDYGPIPPWLDRFHILIHDDVLLWRNTPNVDRTYVDIFSPVWRESDRISLLRRFSPSLPEEFKSNPRWAIRLNSHGDRDREIADRPQPSTIRIACIGDSWTFGMNVNQEQTYPSRLAARLLAAQPGQQFEVVNLGVLGYSSLQGLRLLQARVLGLHPNIVVIGFAMNDSEVAGYRDKDSGNAPRAAGLARIKEAAETFESYKLLNYLALTVKFHPHVIADYLKDETQAKAPATVNYDDLEAWTRVSPHDYDRNVREMIGLARRQGASVILLDNELWGESPYRPVLRKISSDLDVPLVDSYAIIENMRQQIQQDLESRLDLGSRADVRPKAASGVTVVFRVSSGAFPVPKRLSIVGTDPQLGSLSPNTVAMHDDGTDGDQRAADGVWSYAATFHPGDRISYVYTNSGRPGQWEGLDLPNVRSLQVPAVSDNKPVYLPIDTFGRIYMQADNWHTDSVGYDLIARALAATILRSVRP